MQMMNYDANQGDYFETCEVTRYYLKLYVVRVERDRVYGLVLNVRGYQPASHPSGLLPLGASHSKSWLLLFTLFT